MKKIIILLMLTICYAGGPFDHTVQAFGNFKKPMEDITFWDRSRGMLDHAKTDALIAENGKNLVFTQGFCTIVAYEKAKSVGYGPQFKGSMLYANMFDIVDKLITGRAISYQLEQVPYIGEYLSMLVPAFSNHSIIHSINGYPKPSYTMTEEQYYWFQSLELALFIFELDSLKVKDNLLYAEIVF